MDTAQAERLARFRAHGARIQQAIEDLATEVGVDDPLDRLAFLTGTMRSPDPVSGVTPPFTYRFHSAKEEARAGGYTWNELAVAMGEGADDKAMRRVRSRFVDNAARLAEIRGGS